MFFPGLTLFMIFILWFTWKRISVERKEKNEVEAFWKMENQANSTRKQDLSQLDYVQIPLDALPFVETQDETILQLQEEIRELAPLKILNLTGLTNTELKLTYGAANLDVLAQYDANFTKAVKLLNSWGTRLYDANFQREARAVLEYAVGIGSDVKATYTLLARMYKEQGEPGKIAALGEQAARLNSLSKNIILKNLEQISGG